jgi:hypothetical protein
VACTYTITYTSFWITYWGSENPDLPPWITFNAGTRTFSADIDDRSYATTATNTYHIYMRAEIGADQTVNPVSDTIGFEVVITDPCLVETKQIAANIGTVARTYWIGDTADTWSYDPYVSKVDGTYSVTEGCGPITSVIAVLDSDYNTYVPMNFTEYPWMSIDWNVGTSKFDVTVDTSDVQYATNAAQDFYIYATLDEYQYEYPILTNKDMHWLAEPFTVTLKNCQVNSFNMPTLADVTWNVYTPVYWHYVADFTENPDASTVKSGDTDCGYVITYEYKWKTYWDTVIDLPAFLTWNNVDKRFEWQTDDPSWITTVMNTYEIQVIGTIDSTQQNPALVGTTSFILTVNNGCLDDEMTVTVNNAADYIYYINEDTFAPGLAYVNNRP